MLLARLRGWVHPMVFLFFFLPSRLSLPPSSSFPPSTPPSSHMFIERPVCKGSRSGPVVTVTLISFCSRGPAGSQGVVGEEGNHREAGRGWPGKAPGEVTALWAELPSHRGRWRGRSDSRGENKQRGWSPGRGSGETRLRHSTRLAGI